MQPDHTTAARLAREYAAWPADRLAVYALSRVGEGGIEAATLAALLEAYAERERMRAVLLDGDHPDAPPHMSGEAAYGYSCGWQAAVCAALPRKESSDA